MTASDHDRGELTPAVPATVERSWNPRLALLLSLVLPGAGQIYKGQRPWLIGLYWFTLVGIGYLGLATRREWILEHDGRLSAVPGFVFHFVCIADAYWTDPNPGPVANAEQADEEARVAGLARAEERGARIGRAAAEAVFKLRRILRMWI